MKEKHYGARVGWTEGAEDIFCLRIWKPSWISNGSGIGVLVVSDHCKYNLHE